MEQQFCQSCGMPLTDTNKGTNSDGSLNDDYCMYCYQKGKFTQDFTMNQMIEFCAQFTEQINKETGWNLTPEQAKKNMKQFFPTLKRWKEKDERALTEKATGLLAQCKDITIASIDAEGFPRPVHFKLNNKAGLCYSNYGDSVGLRGFIEIITDDNIRKEMWQDWLINYFPGGPTEPNFVLLHFIGKEATFWINGEFAHEKL